MLPDWVSKRPLRFFLPLQAVVLGVQPDLLPVWGDEQFTLGVIERPWGELLGALAADIHPPLYFVLVKLWAGLLAGIDPEIAARLFSVLCALLTTVALDLLWLRGRPRAERLWFLGLWTLSPLVLLYGRMARSYALQTLLATLAFHAAGSAVEQPNRKRLAAVAVGIAALLYTHYLPGLAVGFSVVLLLARRSWRAALAVVGGAGLLYLPWAPILLDGLFKAATKEVYRLAPGVVTDLGVRIGYWVLAFTFGETQTWTTLAAAAVLSLLLGWLLIGQRPRPTTEQRLALWAAPLGLLGTWRWVSFAFTPARLMFLAPAWLLTLSSLSATRLGRAALTALLTFYVAADGLYFARVGLLNPGYEIRFESIATEIERTSDPDETLVLVDSFNADPAPLLDALDPRFAVVVAVDAEFPKDVAAALAGRRPETIWYLRTARDISPGALHEAMEARFDRDCRARRTLAYAPYSDLQRRALRLLTNSDAPPHHYQVRRYGCVSD